MPAGRLSIQSDIIWGGYQDLFSMSGFDVKLAGSHGRKGCASGQFSD